MDVSGVTNALSYEWDKKLEYLIALVEYLFFTLHF